MEDPSVSCYAVLFRRPIQPLTRLLSLWKSLELPLASFSHTSKNLCSTIYDHSLEWRNFSRILAKATNAGLLDFNLKNYPVYKKLDRLGW
jgi:hypothetical protein